MPTYGQQCTGQIDCIDPFCSLVPGLINFLLAVVEVFFFSKTTGSTRRTSMLR